LAGSVLREDRDFDIERVARRAQLVRDSSIALIASTGILLFVSDFSSFLPEAPGIVRGAHRELPRTGPLPPDESTAGSVTPDVGDRRVATGVDPPASEVILHSQVEGVPAAPYRQHKNLDGPPWPPDDLTWGIGVESATALPALRPAPRPALPPASLPTSPPALLPTPPPAPLPATSAPTSRAYASPMPSFGEEFLALIPFAALLAVAVSGLTLVVSALSTASAVTLGWREERRKQREYHLKIEQLELQLIEARAKSPPAPPRDSIGY
jgi:hypothetical protein